MYSMNFVKIKSFATSCRGRVCPLQVRWLCSHDNPGDSSNQEAPDRYIPDRIKKRLKARGLTEADLEISQEPTQSLNLQQALRDTVVEKNVDIDFPSDIIQNNLNQRLHYQKHASTRSGPSVDPKNTSILLFPGQGSQFVGMGSKLLSYPGVEELYNKASNILGYDLLNVCINGPVEKLNKTVYCQPAVVVTSLAAMERLKEEVPKAVDSCTGVAGFSVGEFTAMIVSGMLSFEDALYLIKIRAEAMQRISERVNGGMMTVVCDHKSKLRVAMVAAREYCSQKLNIEEPVCQVANYLCSNTKVIAGNNEALDFLQKYGQEWHLYKMKRLPVSGPFHTDLMHDRSKDFYRYFDAWDKITVNTPKFSVYSNVEATKYRVDEKGLEGLKYIMKKQMYKPVKWEQIILTLFKRPPEIDCPQVYEVGPGRQLGYLLRKTHTKAFDSYKNIEC